MSGQTPGCDQIKQPRGLSTTATIRKYIMDKTPGGQDSLSQHRVFIFNFFNSFNAFKMPRDKRQKRDIHAFDEDGMVMCNPRDKEAALRAQTEDIATYEWKKVTCRKCLSLFFKYNKASQQQAKKR